MKVIVTGASGFVGGHVARYLNEKGHHITGLSRRGIPDIGISHIKTDLSKTVTKKLPFKNFDVIVHSAALTEFNANYDHAYAVNVFGTKHPYILAQKHKVKKFIHISSYSVYKEFTDRKRVNETFAKATAKTSTYSRTKLLAEEYLKKQKSMATICLRPHVVYGPGDMTVLSQFLEKIKFNKIVLPLDISKEFSITYVKNLVEGVDFFLSKKMDKGFHAFNISDKDVLDSVTLIQHFLDFSSPSARIYQVPKEIGYVVALVATLIARMQRKSPELTVDLINQLNNNSSLSLNKISKLGFESKYSFDEGLKETKAWFERFDGMRQFFESSEDVWPKIIVSGK